MAGWCGSSCEGHGEVEGCRARRGAHAAHVAGGSLRPGVALGSVALGSRDGSGPDEAAAGPELCRVLARVWTGRGRRPMAASCGGIGGSAACAELGSGHDPTCGAKKRARAEGVMRPRTLGLFALLCVLVAYASVWTAGFVYESHPAPVTLETLWRFEWYWQPRALSYWVMGQLHGVNAGAQHGISLGLHLLTGTLVGLLGVRLGLSRIAAVAAGSLFLVHPLAVETVAYVTSRTDQLAAIGVLTACILAP